MKNTIRYSLSLIIAMLLCIIIAPCAFAEDTVYTTSDVTGGVRIDSVTTTETKLVIPEEIGGKVVVALAGKAFTGTPVEEITVPAGVTSMNSYIAGDYSAFYGMENLKKVTFAEGMRTIPSGTLSGCTTVTQVVLPESITTISDKAFYGCSSLTTINFPDSITFIGEEAFYNCTSLETVDLPDNLESLGMYSFMNCTKIESVILPDVLKTIGAKSFAGTKITEIIIPANVTSMYRYAYGSALEGMQYLKKVTFSEGMRTIPDDALLYCSTVTEVVLPESLTAISGEAFYGCTALETINLPDSITSIGEEAFYNCTSLAAVELPDNLESLGMYAFMNCTKIDSVILPDTLKTIGAKSFAGTKITEIIIPANVTSMYRYAYGSALEGMQYLKKVTFSEGMRTIPADALLYCSTVTEVVLPESLTAISGEAFYGCTSLTTINLPDSITSIGEEAFYNCTSLAAVELPDNLESLGMYAFMNCTKIDSVILPDVLKTIGAKSFAGTKITEIIIPANVTSMYRYAYGSALEGMQYLKKVTFAEGMRTVPGDALLYCSTVTEVVLPESLTSISGEAFYGCTALVTINLPDSVTSIGNSAFYDCTSLTSVDLPDNLQSLGNYAFMSCAKIDSIVLPDTLTTIGKKAFAETKIAEIAIPATVTSMYYYPESALHGMLYLEKVTFSDGMDVVPSNALYGCEYLEEVVIYDCNTSLEAMQADAEANGYTLTVLPCGECQHENTEIRNAVAVTCLENGYTGDTYCTDCEELITEGEVIAAAGSHDYKSETVKAATCEAEGEVKYTCSVCGDSYTEATEKDHANHTGDTEIRDAKDATCSEKGYTGDTYCKACGAKLEAGTETEKTAHTEVVVKGSDAKCTAPGMTDGTECSVCGTVIKAQEEIPATGHTYGEWTVVKNPTATEEGVEERICTSCGEAEARTIEKLSYIVGDVNGDGRITAADARLALRIAAHIDTIEALGTSLVVCDITLDNKVTAADARIILRKAAGLE